MPEEFIFWEDENALQWFIGGITNKILAKQVTTFILLALESNSEREIKTVLIKLLRWLALFDKNLKEKGDNNKLREEIQTLLYKLYIECLVFCVPFFWPEINVFKKIKGELRGSRKAMLL